MTASILDVLMSIDVPWTATQVWMILKMRYPKGRGPTLATVSGILHRLHKRGTVGRVEGFGPRGGYGYTKVI